MSGVKAIVIYYIFILILNTFFIYKYKNKFYKNIYCKKTTVIVFLVLSIC